MMTKKIKAAAAATSGFHLALINVLDGSTDDTHPHRGRLQVLDVLTQHSHSAQSALSALTVHPTLPVTDPQARAAVAALLNSRSLRSLRIDMQLSARRLLIQSIDIELPSLAVLVYFGTGAGDQLLQQQQRQSQQSPMELEDPSDDCTWIDTVLALLRGAGRKKLRHLRLCQINPPVRQGTRLSDFLIRAIEHPSSSSDRAIISSKLSSLHLEAWDRSLQAFDCLAPKDLALIARHCGQSLERLRLELKPDVFAQGLASAFGNLSLPSLAQLWVVVARRRSDDDHSSHDDLCHAFLSTPPWSSSAVNHHHASLPPSLTLVKLQTRDPDSINTLRTSVYALSCSSYSSQPPRLMEDAEVAALQNWFFDDAGDVTALRPTHGLT